MNIHAPIKTGEKGRIRKEDRGIVWTDENIALAAKMYADGYFGSHIAKHFGVTRNSFCGLAARNRDLFPKRLGTMSIPQTKRGTKWDKEKIDECLRLRKAGKTMKAISSIIGITENSVAHVIRKHKALFDAPAAPVEIEPMRQSRRSFIAGKWVERVPFVTISGAVVSLPRVSIINGKEG